MFSYFKKQYVKIQELTPTDSFCNSKSSTFNVRKKQKLIKNKQATKQKLDKFMTTHN